MERYSKEQIREALKAIGFDDEVIGNLEARLRECLQDKSNNGDPDEGTAERRSYKSSKRISFRCKDCPYSSGSIKISK